MALLRDLQGDTGLTSHGPLHSVLAVVLEQSWAHCFPEHPLLMFLSTPQSPVRFRRHTLTCLLRRQKLAVPSEKLKRSLCSSRESLENSFGVRRRWLLEGGEHTERWLPPGAGCATRPPWTPPPAQACSCSSFRPPAAPPP